MAVEPVTYEEAKAGAERWTRRAQAEADNGVYLGAQCSAVVAQAWAALALALRPCSPWCQSGRIPPNDTEGYEYVPPF